MEYRDTSVEELFTILNNLEQAYQVEMNQKTDLYKVTNKTEKKILKFISNECNLVSQIMYYKMKSICDLIEYKKGDKKIDFPIIPYYLRNSFMQNNFIASRGIEENTALIFKTNKAEITLADRFDGSLPNKVAMEFLNTDIDKVKISMSEDKKYMVIRVDKQLEKKKNFIKKIKEKIF